MAFLSIIIPTADRQTYAANAAAAVADACPDAEIIISDTSLDSSLEAMLAPGIASGQVRYMRPGVGLDVVSNFNHACEAATGRWLMFIGDDDCVGPDVERIAAWADQNGIEAVVSYGAMFHAAYYWPGVTSRYFGEDYAARLVVNRVSGKARALDAPVALKAALHDFGGGLGLMPRAYHGLVSRDVVDRIREQHGALFGGVSPDIYSATLISRHARKTAVVEWPFVLPGASPKSTAGMGAAQTDRSALWDNPHIAPFRGLVWDPLIPEFYSPTTVWSFSFKKAVDAVNDPAFMPNFARLYARCLFHNRSFAATTMQSVNSYGREVGLGRARRLVAFELLGEAGRFGTKVASRLARPTAAGHAVATVTDLPDVRSAYAALVETLRHGPQLDLG